MVELARLLYKGPPSSGNVPALPPEQVEALLNTNSTSAQILKEITIGVAGVREGNSAKALEHFRAANQLFSHLPSDGV